MADAPLGLSSHLAALGFPQVGDRVVTPLGPGEVVAICRYDTRARKWTCRLPGETQETGTFDHGPYAVRLDDGRLDGFGFDHAKKEAAR